LNGTSLIQWNPRLTSRNLDASILRSRTLIESPLRAPSMIR